MQDSQLDWFYDQMAELSPVVFSHSDPNELLASLPESKRCLFYVGSFLGQIDNGGVEEYLLGPCGDDAERAIQFLHVIGVTEIGDAFSGLYEKLPAESHACPPFDRDGRQKILSGSRLTDDLERLSAMICRRSDDARKVLVEYCQPNW